MQIRELIADIIANPTAYTDAFPVSTPAAEERADWERTLTQMVGVPLNRGGVAQRILEGRYSMEMHPVSDEAAGAQLTPEMFVLDRFRERAIGDVRLVDPEQRPQMPAWAGISRAPFPPAEYGEATRLGHYRTHTACCSCGFHSIYHGDMAAHLRGDVVEEDGVPKRWERCGKCFASRLCREVVLMTPPQLSFTPLDDPSQPPAPPTYQRVRWCDNCARGL